MALYEMKVFSQYFNQQCLNVFHYQTNSPTVVVTGSFALAAAMGFVGNVVPEVSDIYALWKNIVSDQVLFTEIQVTNPYDAVDFYTQPLVSNNTGTQPGVAESPSIAYALQTNRSRRDIRRGNKRLVGAVQSSFTSGGVLTAGSITALDDLCSGMSANLVYTDEGSPISFTPVIVSKQAYTTPSGKTAYQYYPTESEQEQNLASSVIWGPKPFLSTQVSRKRGRGI